MSYERILLIGDPGTGKTATLLTAKGKRYADVFDQAAIATLVADPTIEYMEWFPDPSKLSLSVSPDSCPFTDLSSIPYNRWVKEIQTKIRKGFFNDVDVYMIDSLTLLGASCFDATKYAKSWGDRRQAYGEAGDTIIRAISLLYSLPCHVILTIHNRSRKRDGVDAPATSELSLPLHAREFLPRVASNVWHTHTNTDKGGETRYFLQTRPDRINKGLKTSIRFQSLPAQWDVTIKDFTNPTNYGLGTIL